MSRRLIAGLVMVALWLLALRTSADDVTLLPGFSPSRTWAEQERWQRMSGDVRLFLSGPLPVADGPRTLVLYATPNGNTIEQTLGSAPAPGRDWHFDIQHVAAQIRKLREVSPAPPVVLAVVQSPKLSWPAFRQDHADASARIRRLVEQTIQEVNATRAVLAGHSGGGSLLFGFIEAYERLPAIVERFVFLDANYAYSNDQRHGDKLLTWLGGDAQRRLIAIAYDDREITLAGKRVVGPAGGTYRATQRMLDRFARDLTISSDTVGPFARQRALDGRIELLVHPNPENKILHTALVGEMNGLLYGLALGTPSEGAFGQLGGPRAYTRWIQADPAVEAPLTPTLTLPPRPPDAPTGAQFAREIASLPRAEREIAVLREISRGNVPAFLRTLRPISLAATDEHSVTHRGTCFVTPDYLAVGTDDDFFRLPMTPQTGQAIAKLAGAHLITAALSDAIHRQADLQLEPRPLTQNRDAAATFYQHQQMIEGQRRGHPLGLLVAGIKKDVVLTNRLRERPQRVAIVGWHYPEGKPIQPLYVGHVDWYVDYSHGIRLMSDTLLVDGQVRHAADVMQDSVVCGLLSNEGPITVTY